MLGDVVVDRVKGKGFYRIKKKRDLEHPHRREVTVEPPYRVHGTDILIRDYTVVLWPTGTKGEPASELTCTTLDEAIQRGTLLYLGKIRGGRVRPFLSANDFCALDYYHQSEKRREVVFDPEPSQEESFFGDKPLVSPFGEVVMPGEFSYA